MTEAQTSDELEPFVVTLDPKEELVRSIVEPVICAEGCLLVHLQLVQGARRAILRLHVARAEGDGHIPLDSLEKLNHMLGDLLDVEDEHRGLFRGQYNLEVSSPGLDRPLSKRSHFEQSRGKRVKVKTRTKVSNARSFTGTLTAVDDAGIRVGDDKSATAIGWRDLAEAHVVFEFDHKSAPKPKRSKKKGS
jgi:ribosome maturation factor RimP